MTTEISLFSECAWEALADLLDKKLVTAPTMGEEDLRHCAVRALESVGIFPKGAICLNYEHPSFKGKKIDLFLPAFSKQGAIACELKYDHATPSGHNQPRSTKAGAIVNDFLRLAHFSVSTEIERFLVYLTDQEMYAYICNPRNGFSRLFEPQQPIPLKIGSEFVAERSASVKRKIGVPIISCSIFKVLNQSLSREHNLLVFLVKPE